LFAQVKATCKKFSGNDGDKDFFAAGINKLIKTWDKCINVAGDYVEK